MRHRQQQPPTIAILGTGTFSEDILARLLQKEGYDARLVKVHPNVLTDEWLDGADVLLFTPGQEGDARHTTTSFLGAARSIPDEVAVPLLLLPSP